MNIKTDHLLAGTHNIRLTSADDAIAILETGLPGMIFATEDIDGCFFDLKNGILGETFQKLVNYRFPIAVVLPDDHGYGIRVTELAREHSKHTLIRFCSTMEEAEEWMSKVVEE